MLPLFLKSALGKSLAGLHFDEIRQPEVVVAWVWNSR